MAKLIQLLHVSIGKQIPQVNSKLAAMPVFHVL